VSAVSLLPRLTPIGVDRVSETCGLDCEAALQYLAEHSSLVSFAASGGTKDDLASPQIGERLRQIAEECGFPENTSQVARARFDHMAASFLATDEKLASGEGLRDDVWAYLTAVVAPDLVAWRFSKDAAGRFAGGVRNAFQRLWLRGRTLDRGEHHADRWGLVRALTEDALVQIFERPSIGGNRRLAVALAEGWVRAADRLGRGAMEPVMRAAAKIVRLRNEIVDLALLDDHELEGFIDEAFLLKPAEYRSGTT
jgi:hypothetical protein